jgi:hypothetical protein
VDIFPVRVDNGNIVTRFPLCRKTLYTTSNFIDHINHDVLPALLDRPSKSENAEPADADFIDTATALTLSERSGGSRGSKT